MSRLATAIIFRLDTAIIFRLATAIIFRLDTAIIFRLDAAIIFRLDTAIGSGIEPILILLALVHKFPKTQFAPQSFISMIWSCRSVLPSQNRDAHLFHVEKNTVLMISNDFDNFMVLGPRPPGVMGPFSVLTFFEKLFYGLGPI